MGFLRNAAALALAGAAAVGAAKVLDYAGDSVEFNDGRI